jgi:hypothetical protein
MTALPPEAHSTEHTNSTYFFGMLICLETLLTFRMVFVLSCIELAFPSKGTTSSASVLIPSTQSSHTTVLGLITGTPRATERHPVPVPPGARAHETGYGSDP